MPTSSTAYGSTAPSAIDPFPIESVLAKIVGENNPANAQNMLNTYQVENQTSQGNYNYNLNQQHDFAKQQLAQQLQENYMKYGQEAVKTPGGLSLLGAQTGGAALGGLDPTQLETNLRTAQLAKQVQEAGGGIWSLTNAGFQPSSDAAAAITGGVAGPQGTPLPLAIAQFKEGEANKRHASSEAGAAGPGVTGPVTSTDPSDLTPYQANYGKKFGPNDPRTITNLRARGLQKPGVPGALPDAGTAPAGDATTPAPSRTSLPNAPASTTRAPATTDGAAARQRVEANVENKVRISNSDAYKDITAGKVGGRVNIVRQDSDGKVVIKGKTGQEYRMTP